jgi:ABC-2 type transport system ATP-binding protein
MSERALSSQPAAEPSHEGRPAPAIELTALRKTYGAVTAVDRVDLTVPRGQVIALLGPNGAGKSTTIDLLLGLGRADSGEARLFGLTPHEAVAAGQVGVMLQTGAVIMGLSVRELVTMMASLYRKPLPVDGVLELAGLADVADREAMRLSGGQTQRVRFAVALVSDPDLLVLDEPTAALDVAARHAFWETVRGFAQQGRTVLFATHFLEEADRFADRIVLMAGGRIVANGSATEIKSVVNVRTVRATLPDVPDAELAGLPGVVSTERHGASVTLRCNDSDRAVRALLDRYDSARDVEVVGAGIDEAFLHLTGSDAQGASA